MSDAGERSDKRPGKEEDHPTASFGGSAPGSQTKLRSFDYFDFTQYKFAQDKY